MADVSSMSEPKPTVPMIPVVPNPFLRIDRSRKQVDVLPLVPVTPTTVKPDAGSPKNLLAISAAADEASLTTMVGTVLETGLSTASAEAPRLIA